MLPRPSALLAASALLALTLASGSAAAAVSITNRDDKDHKLTVIEDDGAKKSDIVLKAGQVQEGICPKGCVIRLNESEEDEYELEGTEVVSIEEGYLYYDGPEGPAEPPAGKGGEPAAPAAPTTPPAPDGKKGG